jgi:hypothetical protein
MTPQRTPKEDLLVGGLDDWADLGWVIQSARLTGATDSAALRALALALIRAVLEEGLMVAGDIVGGDFQPWSTSSEASVSRIEGEWAARWGDAIPTPGSIAWLANTERGDALARNVLRREAGD